MFSYETTVSYSRTDRNGKVPMHEILNLLQDCSTFHSEDIGHGVSYMKREARAWVLVAYKVIVNRPIMFGQKITIGTSPSKFSSMFASRQYFIKDENGDYLVQADSLWVLIDIQTRKPLRITEEDSSTTMRPKRCRLSAAISAALASSTPRHSRILASAICIRQRGTTATATLPRNFATSLRSNMGEMHINLLKSLTI